MSLLKVVQPSGWDFGEPIMSPVKMSTRGLVGNDRKFFLKRAGDASSIFLPYLDHVKIAADEEPVHAIALGAYERFSINRNGDAFAKKACETYHDTFVKLAKPFRNHRNRPEEGHPYFGVVKASAYNPTMHRVELLIAYNKNKSAADRNGGQIADKELEKLAKDGEFPVSMAARVGYDKCLICGNEARTRDEYCTAEKCAGGGCKDNLAKVVKIGNDIAHVGVDNPHPTFFDISHVFRPACRTAYGARADWLRKAAEDTFAGIGGAKLAEELGIIAPLAVTLQDTFPGAMNERLRTQVKLAHALSKLERSLAPSSACRRAFSPDVQPALDFSLLGADPGHPEKVATALCALADAAIILPLRDFAGLTKKADLGEKAAQCLPGAYGRMIADGTLEWCVAHNPFSLLEASVPLRQKIAAAELTRRFSLAQDCVVERAQLSALRTSTEPGRALTKTAGAGPEAESLARAYALYKLAALARIAEFDDVFALTATLALHQNDA